MDIDTAWILIGGFFLLIYMGLQWIARTWIWPRLRPRWHQFLDAKGWNDYTRLRKDNGSDEWVSNEQLEVLFALASLGAPAKATQIHDEVIRSGTTLKGSIYRHLGQLEEFGLVTRTTSWVEPSSGDDLDPGPGGFQVCLYHLNVKLPPKPVKARGQVATTPVAEGA